MCIILLPTFLETVVINLGCLLDLRYSWNRGRIVHAWMYNDEFRQPPHAICRCRLLCSRDRAGKTLLAPPCQGFILSSEANRRTLSLFPRSSSTAIASSAPTISRNPSTKTKFRDSPPYRKMDCIGEACKGSVSTSKSSRSECAFMTC